MVCNQRYIEMFGLSPDVVKPGCSIRDLIDHRKETGSFNGDVDEFCADGLRDVARGKMTHQVIGDRRTARSIQIVNQPLPDGGWVTTHRGHHRAQARRGAHHPSRALRSR